MKTLRLLLLLSCSCGVAVPDSLVGEIPFEPERPTLLSPDTVAPYAGNDPLVLEALGRYPTGLDLHRKLILRSCGGTGGVCHNQKEYPDMHTPANFVGIIGAPCNVQPGSWSTVYDRCERLGDRFRFGNDDFREIEVGWIEFIAGEYVDYRGTQTRPTESSPGLHWVLKDALPADVREGSNTGLFIRNFINVRGEIETLPFASYSARYWILGDRKHLFAEVRNNQLDSVNGLLAAGIIQGDHNRNQIFGAHTGKTVTLLNPGKPEESYLVARLRGLMQAERVPGSRMPLANQPPSIPDMLALMCFIEGLNASATAHVLSSPIDFAQCSYTANPSSLNLVGQGVTWRQRVLPILQSNCGGCHGGANPQKGLDVLAEGAHARLLKPSTQRPTLNLIQPGSPEKSYLWLKLNGDGSVVGQRMPIDPILGAGQLPQDALNDIETWILAGALEDG